MNVCVLNMFKLLPTHSTFSIHIPLQNQNQLPSAGQTGWKARDKIVKWAPPYRPKKWRKKQVLKELYFTIPFSPFPSILRAPCVASKSVMALETLSPVAASYSACQFRSIEVVVVVQVCTGACSKENPRCKATPNLSSLKVGSEGHYISIQTGWLHMHECLQCGNDSWKHCVLFIDAEDKVGWDFAAYQAWSTSTTVFIIFHHLPATKILVKEMTPQTCFSVSVPQSLLQEKLRKSEAWLAQHSNKNSAVCRFFLRDGGSFIRMHTVFITHTYHSGFQCRS